MRYVSFDEVTPEPGQAVVTIPELGNAGIHGRNVELSDEFEDYSDEAISKERDRVYQEAVADSFERYQKLIKLGVAPENARMVLPIGTKVNMVMSVNARMLMHIADMRASGEAQWEIREMTESILDKAKDWCPITFEYYEEKMKNRKNRLAP
jgi:thymidylate synthase (FAD)